MNDEELFRRMMDSLGVDPIGRRETRGRPKRRAAPEDETAETASETPDDEDDESLFLDSMSDLDVAPLPHSLPERRKKPREQSQPPRKVTGPQPRAFEPQIDDEFEDSVFLDTIDGLVVVPDKDDRFVKPETPRPRKVQPPRLPRLSKQHSLSIDEQVDLHGQTVEEALANLRSFLGSAVSGRSRTVLVVTGKGHHSEAGRSVLRQAVERWIRRDGASWVREYSDAPRALGGGGAFVVWLR